MLDQPSRPLLVAFPDLRSRLPFVPLADLPTPLTHLARLSDEAGAQVWVKRDGLTHPLYGGNKIRKFEFVFGDLLRRGSRAVITGGGLGSHHTLATAVVARQFGVQPVLSYFCQPITDDVHRNLLRSVALGVDAHFCGDYAGLVASLLWQYIRWLARTRRSPYFVYPGASGPLGILGYVNAAFELKAQIHDGGQAAPQASQAPEQDLIKRSVEQRGATISPPDALFVAVGSCGTFAGLLLGARLANLSCRIVGVQVAEPDVANRPKIARLANRTARYMRRLDASVPDVHVEAQEIEWMEGYLGPGYAYPTSAACQAVERAWQLEGLPLETTYTGKAMAALLDCARQQPGSTLLFVDTYAETARLEEGDYHGLPKRFWGLFEPSQAARCWCLRGWRDPGFCWKHQARRRTRSD